MRKAIVVLGSLFLCFFLFKVGIVGAEDGAVVQEEVVANIEGQKEIKGNMEAARAEEKQLRQRIADALQANDLQTVAQLKEELRAMHQENVQGMQQDRQAIQAARQELKNDVQEVRQEGDNNLPGSEGKAGVSLNRAGAQGRANGATIE